MGATDSFVSKVEPPNARIGITPCLCPRMLLVRLLLYITKLTGLWKYLEKKDRHRQASSLLLLFAYSHCKRPCGPRGDPVCDTFRRKNDNE